MKRFETADWADGGACDAVLPRQVRTAAHATDGLLRYSQWDALLVVLALGQGVLLLSSPPGWLIALGLWWNANTVSHNFIHLPFFRSCWLNRLFSAYLSVLLGFPQRLWRERHLAHHRGERLAWKRLKPDGLMEGALVLGWWLVLLGTDPVFFVRSYLPGWLAGLALCQVQGFFEHDQGTISHYSRLYNWLFLNDGFHIEHHAHPARHWTRLPQGRKAARATRSSRWPAVLRWMEWLSLDGLEQLVARSRRMQAFVLARHESAFRRLQPLWAASRQVIIVGGGLFPRTALVFRRIAPEARLRIVDARADHLAQARAWLDGRVEVACDFYPTTSEASRGGEADLVVIPLAFIGDKSAIYRHPPARHVLVHDWIWRKRGHSVIISVLLLKRLNLVQA